MAGIRSFLSLFRGALQNPFLDRLDLERKIFRIDPVLREAAGDEPQAWLPGARIHVAQLDAVAKAPGRADTVGDAVAEQLSHQIFLRLVAGGEHDEIGGDGRAVLHPRAFGDEAFDVGVLLQLDRALDDEIGTADIKVIAAATGEVFELPAGAGLAEIELEADVAQAVEQLLVELLRLLRQHHMRLLRKRRRHRGRDEVVVLERALIVGRIGELRGGLDIGDQRRRTLYQRYLGAAGAEILRDVVDAVAGADDDGALALPALAVLVAARMQQRAFEIVEGRNVGLVGDAADAGRHHHVARMHAALAAVGAPQRDRPALPSVVVGAALELGAGPEVQLHGIDVSLEPV